MKGLGGKTNAMVGELDGEAEMIRQMQAIFLTMSKDYQIRYVLAPFSYDSPAVQKVKAPEEVIRTKSGLCIELAMLMAAALENIGLNPVIVLTTGHAWVGIEMIPQSGKFSFIETTALDKTPIEAMAIAKKNWEAIKDNPGYEILRVSEERAEGLLPIKY
jgi:hypothetical protein